MPRHASIAVLALAFLTSAAGVRHGAAPERIQTHDNERAAGTLTNGVLRLRLETRTGSWYPMRLEVRSGAGALLATMPFIVK